MSDWRDRYITEDNSLEGGFIVWDEVDQYLAHADTMMNPTISLMSIVGV